MPELLVMRHAKSAWDTNDADHDRPLAPRGIRAAARMAQWLLTEDLEPDVIAASTATRAVATLRPTVELFGIEEDRIELREDLYGADVSDWLAVLQARSEDRVMIVGHNPGLDGLVLHVSRDALPLSASGKLMTTAAIARFNVERWGEISPSSAQLIDLVRPRELR